MKWALLKKFSPPTASIIELFNKKCQDLDKYKQCIDNGAKMDFVYKGKSMLSQAVYLGNVEIVELLIENGANVYEEVSIKNRYKAEYSWQTSYSNVTKESLLVLAIQVWDAPITALLSKYFKVPKDYLTKWITLVKSMDDGMDIIKNMSKKLGFSYHLINVSYWNLSIAKYKQLLLYFVKNGYYIDNRENFHYCFENNDFDFYEKLLLAGNEKRENIRMVTQGMHPIHRNKFYEVLRKARSTCLWSTDMHRFYPYAIMDRVLYMLLMHKYGPVDMDLPWDIMEMVIKKVV